MHRERQQLTGRKKRQAQHRRYHANGEERYSTQLSENLMHYRDALCCVFLFSAARSLQSIEKQFSCQKLPTFLLAHSVIQFRSVFFSPSSAGNRRADAVRPLRT